ncbi:hypothetical protein AVEN_52125-1 [Araneus ventricosus]|uniref:Uncharacterized protein n=1 Tax=Araneus ventricosus TaxID=182803 RepID=A0A4Y2E471_ARAVE|nr:hypothetical protein AVEN_52125-1 [Araneus ventricosus]
MQIVYTVEPRLTSTSRRGEVPDFAPATVISPDFYFAVILIKRGSSDEFLSNMVSREQPYSQRILEISLSNRFLPQNDQNAWEGVTKRTLTFAWKKLWPESVIECDIEESETVRFGAYSQRDCVFGQYQGTRGG